MASIFHSLSIMILAGGYLWLAWRVTKLEVKDR